jgi:hypothetical protein
VRAGSFATAAPPDLLERISCLERLLGAGRVAEAAFPATFANTGTFVWGRDSGAKDSATCACGGSDASLTAVEALPAVEALRAGRGLLLGVFRIRMWTTRKKS